jgi:hypothetical protein
MGMVLLRPYANRRGKRWFSFAQVMRIQKSKPNVISAMSRFIGSPPVSLTVVQHPSRELSALIELNEWEWPISVEKKP